MPPDQFNTCDNHEKIQEIDQRVTDLSATNRTWGIAIGGILSGAALVAIPFLLWLASSVSAHETAISVVKTKMENQERQIAEMAVDIKQILAELRKRP